MNFPNGNDGQDSHPVIASQNDPALTLHRADARKRLARSPLPLRRAACAIAISCGALLTLPSAPAADAGLGAEHIVRSWQIEHGLPQNSVRSIGKDHRGYIWFGTEHGLVHFDGAQFSVYDKDDAPAVSSHYITAVVPKPGGDGLWVGTDGGGLLEWAEGHLRPVAAPPQLASGIVSALCQDRSGALWIGTRGGLSRLENGTVQTWRVAEGLAHDYVRTVFQDAAGTIWIGTYAGVNYVEEGQLKPAPWGELTRAHVRAIGQTSAGHLFFGTNGEGLFGVENGQLRRYTTSDGLGHDVIGGLAGAADGTLWIATYGGGVTRLKDDQFASIAPAQGLSNGLCLSIYPDAQGLVWVGHNGGGLSCLVPRRVKIVDQQSGLAGEIALPILQTRAGDVWVGTATDGVTRFRGDEATTFNRTNGLPGNLVLALGEDREGAVWIGTAGGGGVARYRDGQFTYFTPAEGLGDGTANAILTDRAGRVWLGTEAGGVSIYDGKHFTSLRAADGLVSDSVLCLLQRRSGEIWIGTHGGGISRSRDGHIETVFANATYGNILSLYEDTAGYVWAGTGSGGLIRINDSGQVVRVTEAEGLHSNEVLGIAADDHYAWLSSVRGISRVSWQQLMDVCDGKAPRVEPLLLDKTDGMATAECNGGVSPSAARLANGEIWFPTTRGVAVVDPGLLKEDESAPPPTIQSFSVDEKPMPLGGAVNRLRASSRHFEFACTVPAFRAPQRIRFRYRLDGLDEHWSAPTDRRTAHYTQLPPGNYTFRVVSSGENGVWNAGEAVIRFSIIPPFYKTKLFYVLFALCAAAAVVALHHSRVSRLHRSNARLEESVEGRTRDLAEANTQLHIAKEQADRANAAKSDFLSRMSHELRTPLNAILGFGQLLEFDDLAPQQHESVQHILSGGRHLLALINEVLDLARIEAGRVDLAIEPIDLGEVLAETIALMQPLAADRHLTIVEPAGGCLGAKVMADRQRIKQVLLNLLSNAIKYNTEHGTITVSCGARGDRFSLTVTDTGRGMSPQDLSRLFVAFERLDAEKSGTEGTGLGLSLCKRLIELMNGDIQVESTIGRGSSFSITLPLAAESVSTAQHSLEQTSATASGESSLRAV